MKKFVSYEKASKTERRRRDNEKRNCWSISPVTRVVKDKKKYDRKKQKAFDKKNSYYTEWR